MDRWEEFVEIGRKVPFSDVPVKFSKKSSFLFLLEEILCAHMEVGKILMFRIFGIVLLGSVFVVIYYHVVIGTEDKEDI